MESSKNYKTCLRKVRVLKRHYDRAAETQKWEFPLFLLPHHFLTKLKSGISHSVPGKYHALYGSIRLMSTPIHPTCAHRNAVLTTYLLYPDPSTFTVGVRGGLYQSGGLWGSILSCTAAYGS